MFGVFAGEGSGRRVTLAAIAARLREAGPGAATPWGPQDDVRYFANLAEAFAGAVDADFYCRQ